VETIGRSLGEAILEIHFRVGKVQGLSTELPDRELGSYEGLQRGLRESLNFSIPYEKYRHQKFSISFKLPQLLAFRGYKVYLSYSSLLRIRT
jgi:hypothetical protein